MRSYYKHHLIDWDRGKIEEQIIDLENWDIVYQGKVVGAFRLAFDDNLCYLRDLQISKALHNKGIGTKALIECERLARQTGADKIRLKVFKISPAYNLYTREGFAVDKEDEKFYYMEKNVSR